MPGNEALDHLVNNIDIHFEKSCVEAFITYYNSNISQIPYIPKGNFIKVNKY